MRIISSFRDYYDGVSPGDREPLWVREPKAQPIAPPHPDHGGALHRALEEMPSVGLWLEHCRPAALAFCGRVYRCYTDGAHTIWARAALERELRRGWSFYEGRRALTQPLLDEDLEFLDDAEALFAAHPAVSVERHRAWGSPVAKLWGWSGTLELITNPCLSAMGFAAVLAPHTAWQELDMCLGLMGAPSPDAQPPRSQDLIRDAHGFDARSFRQDAPGKRKARRKANRKRKKDRRS